MKNKIKKIFLNIQDKYPFFGGFLVKTLRFFRFYFYYKPLFFINKFKNKDNNIFKIYWINPFKIIYIFNVKGIDNKKNRNKNLKGNWDLNNKNFNEIKIYQAIKDFFVLGIKWENTDFYNYALNKIKKGYIIYGCYNQETLQKYFSNIEKLYKSIKKEGYKTNSKLDHKEGKHDNYYKNFDEILISIGRNGSLFFNDGAHRLSIAKILGIEKIPIMIVARHKKWVDFKNELKAYAKNHNGKLYQPAYHFDLEDIPYSHGEDRFNLIKDNLEINSGNVLDIGANFGYFCHKFENLDFDCDAVEINPQDAYFMRKLRNANDNKFNIYQESIFDFKKDKKLKYNVVLALYIFHHFLKRKKTYEDLIKLLNRMDCDVMFLGTHNPEEEPFKDVYKNYKPEEFVEFIINNSSLEKYKLLIEFNSGRKLYKLYK